MKLEELKTDFLTFATKYNDEELNLMLNYLCLLLEQFRPESNLLEVIPSENQSMKFKS